MQQEDQNRKQHASSAHNQIGSPRRPLPVAARDEVVTVELSLTLVAAAVLDDDAGLVVVNSVDGATELLVGDRAGVTELLLGETAGATELLVGTAATLLPLLRRDDESTAAALLLWALGADD